LFQSDVDRIKSRQKLLIYGACLSI